MKQKQLTLGSLFDGSGGFPLGGILAGIEPKWSSEIAPFPALVTHRRLPQVKHYGDVSKLSGAELPPVDIITFGSPCQDLSIAGKRAGIHDGERSSLFFQAIRIIKEMRDATNGRYPRYCVWENVVGALSSNKGDDFKSVLEAVIGVKEEGIEVPSPENHRWPKADVYLGDGWSVAYRVFDAQYWGVPQRRARIYLVADFAGESAGEVLFKSEGLSGYTPQGFRSWQGTAGGAEESTGTSGEWSNNGSGVLCVNTQGNSGVCITKNKALALVAQDHGNHPAVLHAAGFSTEHSAKARSIGYEEEVSPTLRAGVVPAALSVENHPTDGRVKIREDGKCQTLCSRAGTGGNNVPLVAEPEIRAFGVCSKHSNAMLSNNPNSGFYEADTAKTIDTSNQSPCKNQGGIAVVALEPGAASRVGGHIYRDGKSGTLRANAGDNQQAVVMPETYSLQGSMIGRSDKNGPQGDGISEGVSFCLNTVDHHAVAAPDPSYTISRDNHFSVSEDVSVTAVARGPATVAAPEADHYSTSKNSHHTVAAHEQANTLVASDWKDPPLVNNIPNGEPVYIVRRLTPVECARLQGFPDWWCADLADENPSDEEIAFWTDVWETWRQVTNPNGKLKTEKQIRKWLADPYTDSAEYALWGNGVALPCPYFVLSGIVWATQNSETLAANCEQTDTKPDD